MEELICPNCKIELVEKRGTSLRTGKPYHFFGCPNYPDCDYVYHEGEKFPPKEKVAGFPPKKEEPKDIIILEKLDEILQKLEAIRKGQEAMDKKLN